MSTDTYHGDHKISARNSTLTLDGSQVDITGSVSLSTASIGTLTVSGTLFSSLVVASGSIFTLNCSSFGANINSTTGNLKLQSISGDISILSGGNLTLTAAGTFNLAAVTASMLFSGNIDLVGQDISIIGQAGQAYIKSLSAGLVLYNKGQTGGTFELQPDSYVRCVTSNAGDGSFSQVMVVENEWNNGQADGLSVVLAPTTLESTNIFFRACYGGDLTNTAGRIRGSDSSSASAFVADAGIASGPTVNSRQDAVFASGGSDFGEWIEVGNIDEWNLTEEHLDFMKDKAPHLGLPEGWVCYVRNGRFYKEGPGTPMLVTKQALVVGNEIDNREGYVGEIFSFSGQIKSITKGVVKSGDLLIPSGSYYCTAISPKDITFEQYKRVIGTAWSDSIDGVDINQTIIAIGVKNTY